MAKSPAKSPLRAAAPERKPVPGFASPQHNHSHCIDDAVTAAARLCESRGARLTEQRRKVLELVWRSHEPIGAYALLAAMQKNGKMVAPPTVYRALDFLVEQGLVHRIESLNAYVGCAAPSARHVGQFLLCGSCGSAAELDEVAIGSAIANSAAAVGFEVTRATVEIRGTCPNCREQGRDATRAG
ncbi:MAG: Fur family transcriptional regulator [Alphaproteobacteria bacterium]